MNIFKQFLLSVICFFWAMHGRAIAAGSTNVETYLSLATIQYYQDNPKKALKIIKRGLKSAPNSVALLELKAVTYRRLNKPKSAAKVYKQLIEIETTRDASAKQIGAYAFELGSINYKAKDFESANLNFSKALDGNFNPITAHLFLGNIAMEEKNWGRARRHFSRVTEGTLNNLKPIAYLRLAEIASLDNDPNAIVRSFIQAKSYAKRQLSLNTSSETKSLARQVLNAANEGLKKIDRSILFGSVLTTSAYDSNVLFTPTVVSSPGNGPSGRGTFKQILQATIGYASSPLKTIQWLPLYSGSMNFNLNADAKTSQFFSNDLVLYAVYRALEPTSYGIRLQSNGTFQFTSTNTTSTDKYRPFTLSGTLAPYIRHELSTNWTLGAELEGKISRYYFDPQNSTDFRRSGPEATVSGSLKREARERYWNPAISLSGTLRSTDGEEFRTRGVELSFSNGFQLSRNIRIDCRAAAEAYFYPDRLQGSRQDTGYTFSGDYTQRFSSSFSLLAGLSYTNNLSNIDDPYQYTRYEVSLGIEYSL